MSIDYEELKEFWQVGAKHAVRDLAMGHFVFWILYLVVIAVFGTEFLTGL